LIISNFGDKIYLILTQRLEDFMKKVEIYTDGACSGNPGKGGWGAVLVYNGREKELSGFDAQTTNNRMELTAVIEALKALKEPCIVTLTTDSKYVCDAINQKWVYSWEANNWRKADKKPALNVDLWEELLALLEEHEVEFVWVKGHDGHKYNERCDELAVSQYLNN
jgi:ribonuclease HI